MSVYFHQVYDIVNPHIFYYRDDLEKHDKAALQGYTGEFIHGWRDTGTNLILFDNIASAKEYEWAVVFTLNNTDFLHGINGRVKRITRDKALAIVQAGARVLAAREAANIPEEAKSDKVIRERYLKLLAEYQAVIPKQ